MSNEDCEHTDLRISSGSEGWDTDGYGDWMEAVCKNCEAIVAEGDSWGWVKWASPEVKQRVSDLAATNGEVK